MQHVNNIVFKKYGIFWEYFNFKKQYETFSFHNVHP